MHHRRPYRFVHPLRGCGDTRGDALYRDVSPDGDEGAVVATAAHFLTQSPSDHSSLITVHSSHTFSAKERDAETGLSYFGARYYSCDLKYPDTMDFLHKNIKKNGVICLLLILDVCLLSSCKTNNVVKAKIATINNECIRNVVDNMLSFADSITDCKYDYYYLIKNQDEKEESYTLQSTNIQEIYSHFGKTTLLMDTFGGHILLFPEKTVDYVG